MPETNNYLKSINSPQKPLVDNMSSGLNIANILAQNDNIPSNNNYPNRDVNSSTIQGGAQNPDTGSSNINVSVQVPETQHFSTDITQNHIPQSQWNPNSIPWSSLSTKGSESSLNQYNDTNPLDRPLDSLKMVLSGGVGGLAGAGLIPYSAIQIDKYLSKIFDKHNISQYDSLKTKIENKLDSIRNKQNLDSNNSKNSNTDSSHNTNSAHIDDATGKVDNQFNSFKSKFENESDPNFVPKSDSFTFSKYFNNKFGENLDDMLYSPGVLKANSTIEKINDFFGADAKILGSDTLVGVTGNFIKGAATAGLAISANDYLDRILNDKNQHDSSALFNGLFLPLAFGAPDMPAFITYAATGSLASLAISSFIPKGSDNPQFSQFLRPTVCSSLLVGASMLLPEESLALKSSYVAGAWLLGNLNHFVFDKPNK